MMLRLKSILCCLMLLSLAFPLGNAWAKQPSLNKDAVSAITLDVLRVEACAKRKGCVVAGGPMQVNLLDMAEDNIDYGKQVLLPERTMSLRLILGDNSKITVDGESFPLTVVGGKRLKLEGWKKAFPTEGGFLSNLELNLNLKKQLVVQRKKVWEGWKNWHGKKKVSYVYSYHLKPFILVRSAAVEQLPENMAAAVVAMPGEESEIKIGENFSLVIPAGAVAAPMVISVKETKYTVEVMNEENGEAVEKPALSSNYELSPDGAKFNEPLVITIPYHPETLPSEVSEYDLAVYLDGEKLPTDINIMPKTATAEVWHFTSATVSYPQTTGKFVFPFKERDKKWQLCQGYNTSEISHAGSEIHSFDFAYGSNNLKGASGYGCWDDISGSEDKTVVAPIEGIIRWIGSSHKDITCFQLKVPVSNGHGKQIRSVKLGHMKTNSARKSVDLNRVLAQGTPIGKLSAPDNCTTGNCGYSHVHMGAYASDDCGSAKKDISVPFGTVFGSGYDFSSDGRKYQWYGREIPADGSQPTSCPGGNGLYCGNSSLGQNVNTLYSCQNGNYQVREQCANGCQTMPAGTNDQCKEAPANCPNGNGAYCGSIDSSLDNNTLYYCEDGNYQALERCSYGCELMPSGTNDRCSYGAAPSLRAVYRFWSDQKQSHFYTISESERDSVIENYPDDQWRYEGVAWYAYITKEYDSLPVYRFWSDKNQSHFYTISEAEKQYVEDTYSDDEWRYEGVEWYAFNYAKAGTTPVYRFWSDQKQSHFYTASEDEKNYVIDNYTDYEWRYEDIAWYVFPHP